MHETINVLLCEDSEHDILATKRAWKKFNIANPLFIVNDGVACMNFLTNKEEYTDLEDAPPISLLLLDLNMPKMGGLEVLKAVRNTPEIRHLKIVVLTTSQSDEDQVSSYDHCVNAYITKPIIFENFAETMNKINMFWSLVQPGISPK
ncbi:response regulator [Kiloniella litopenaei]|uniref:response regulator n=1 Tax=Kiloniella litopenaei TaxID=1549748 RepID=UPI003BAB2474